MLSWILYTRFLNVLVGLQSTEDTPLLSENPAQNVSWSVYMDEIFRGEIIALVFLRFIGLFGQTCLEVNIIIGLMKFLDSLKFFILQTIVTPMMRIFFNYGDFANSILYLCGGFQLIAVFIVLTFASKKFSDRSLIAVGIVINIIAYLWFLILVPTFQKSRLIPINFVLHY